MPNKLIRITIRTTHRLIYDHKVRSHGAIFPYYFLLCDNKLQSPKCKLSCTLDHIYMANILGIQETIDKSRNKFVMPRVSSAVIIPT